MVMGPKDAVESFLQALQRFGIGRLTAILGAGAGVAAVLASVLLHVGAQPESLLYSNLDLKEANQITADLDQAGIKYELKGDGSTIMVDRDSVDKARLLLAGKGLPTAGSVGYEIFDNAPTLGQTEFVQNLNNQRALEGELTRTIMKVQGITSARVHLVMPKRELFDDEAGKPTASVLVGLSGSDLTGDQVRAIRNLIAGAVPNLKADDVTLLDDRGHALALGGDDDNLSGVDAQHKSEVEESLRKRLQSVVEGIVGPGAARVMVTAQLDPSSVSKVDTEFNPDGQVVRTQQTGETKDGNSEGGTNGATTASANIPGGAAPAGSSGANSSTSSQNTETTQYEISNIKTTTVTAPGEIKKLNVSVAVDDLDLPSKDGKAPDTFQKRPDADMQKIHDLVAAAAGIDTTRGDQLQVINVRFNHNVDGLGLGAKKSMFDFDKNDLMRGAEMGVLVLVALLTIFMVARPLLKFINGGTAGNFLAAANSGGQLAMAGGAAGGGHAAGLSAVTAGGSSPLSISGGGGGGIVPVQEQDQRIDIARIEGQVKASSVKKVSEFVERHPEESLSILRGWLHDA